MEAAVAEAKVRGAGSGEDKALAFAANILQKAERSGFDVSLIAARHAGPDLDAWILASALAIKTRSIELMVAAHPGINTPQMVAKMGASVDRISGGRLSINIVNGWSKEEFDLFGNGGWLDVADGRYQRTDEFIQVMQGLWREETFNFDGKFYRAKAGSIRLKTRRDRVPPIYAASHSPEGMLTTAQYCDHWFVPDLGDYRRYEETLALVEARVNEMNELAGRYGRMVGHGLSAHVICADTMEEAVARANDMEAYGRIARYNLSTAKALGACLIGTPEVIAERIRAYEARGIGLLMLHFHPMEQGLEIFSERVMPLCSRAKI
jgi:FMNH2-dependent dimethyl sulfone monooxygenase